jgi:hypothetical protein
MMKTRINFFQIAFIILCFCLAACVDGDKVNPELPGDQRSLNIFEDHLAMKHKSQPVAADRIEKTSGGDMVLSWIIEDQVVILRRALRAPIVSITTEKDGITGIYITEGGLNNSFVYEDDIIFKDVYEDNVMFSYVFEDHVILRSGSPEDLQLSWVTEDIIIFLEFVLEDHIMMKSALTANENTVQLQVSEPKSSVAALMEVSQEKDTLNYTLHLEGNKVAELPGTLQMAVNGTNPVTLILQQSESNQASYTAKTPIETLGKSHDATVQVDFKGHTLYSGYFTIREDIL